MCMGKPRENAHLLGHHGEHRQQNAIELIEAAPQPSLAQPLEDLGAVGVLLLVGAVRHHLRKFRTKRGDNSVVIGTDVDIRVGCSV